MMISRWGRCRDCGAYFKWQWECPAATVPRAACPTCESLTVSDAPSPELALRMEQIREANSYDGSLSLDWRDDVDDEYPNECQFSPGRRFLGRGHENPRAELDAWYEIHAWGSLAYENVVNQMEN